MSYDISLREPDGSTAYLTEAHDLRGGTYAVGGTTECWLNITYNYGGHFRRVFGNDAGVRTIYGLTGADSIPLLEAAISQLGDDVDADYWKDTEGNAKRALSDLLTLAKARPDCVWGGD